MVTDPSQQNADNKDRPEQCPTVLRGLVILKDAGATLVENNHESVVAVFTIVLAFSTIGLWLATAGLQRSTNKLWDAGERQIELAAKTAARQEQHTHVLQRAYIAVDPMGVQTLRNSADKAVAHIEIVNVGNLPARNVRWAIKDCFSPDHILRDFPVEREDASGENTVPPGSRMTQGGGLISLTSAQVLRSEGRYLYVWGIVVYDDGFGGERETRFCHRYNCSNLEETTIGERLVRIVAWTLSSIEARYHRYGNSAT